MTETISGFTVLGQSSGFVLLLDRLKADTVSVNDKFSQLDCEQNIILFMALGMYI